MAKAKKVPVMESVRSAMQSTSRKPELNLELINTELESLESGTKFKIKLNKRQHVRLSIRETDTRTYISINPNRVRTQDQLTELIANCGSSLLLNQ